MADPKALAHAYQQVFAGPTGEIVLRDLVEQGGVLDANAADIECGAWHHGRRSLALYLLNKLAETEFDLVAMARRETRQNLQTHADNGDPPPAAE